MGLNGVSLAAPMVTGGVSLLAIASYNTAGLSGNADSRDGRVMKAVLLNSAEKTSGWDNGQTAFGAGVQTTQSLDWNVGAGRMNLDKAYDQYLAGTTDVAGQGSGNLGEVEGVGWDFGQVIDGADNDYYMNVPLKAGTTFAATLTWFRDRTANGPTVYDNSQSDLDLIFFDAMGGVFGGEVSRSISDYNVVEHLYFTVPSTGYYGIRVKFDEMVFGSQSSEVYGLAWSGVPAVPGDASGDGFVGADDLVTVLTNWGRTGMTWEQGDLTGGGFVGADDYVQVLTHWGDGSPPEPVPEAAALGMLCLGGLVLMKRRR